MFLKDMIKRKGKFIVSFEILKNPMLLSKIPDSIFITQSSFDFRRNCSVYMGYSPRFRIISDEENMPLYNIGYKKSSDELTFTEVIDNG